MIHLTKGSRSPLRFSLPVLILSRKSIRVIQNFINMAKRINPQVSEARIRRTLDLVIDVREGRYQGERSRRRLSPAEYRRLLQRINILDDGLLRCCLGDKLRFVLGRGVCIGQAYLGTNHVRFDYTRSNNCFEIRMPTTHERVVGIVIEKIYVWPYGTMKSCKHERTDLITAAGSIMSSGTTNIDLPLALGEADN